jgi:hypothetical protein
MERETVGGWFWDVSSSKYLATTPSFPTDFAAPTAYNLLSEMTIWFMMLTSWGLYSYMPELTSVIRVPSSEKAESRVPLIL